MTLSPSLENLGFVNNWPKCMQTAGTGTKPSSCSRRQLGITSVTLRCFVNCGLYSKIKCVQSQLSLASIYASLGRLQLCNQQCQQVLGLDPNNNDATLVRKIFIGISCLLPKDPFRHIKPRPVTNSHSLCRPNLAIFEMVTLNLYLYAGVKNSIRRRI